MVTVCRRAAPRGLVQVHRQQAVALMMDAASIAETSVNFRQSTRRNTPENFVHLFV
jgi:hypothetical protein